ncbi:hypothetical protein ANTQUA_LOCUS5879 [Anthophora quadrimaculata]
MYRQILVDPRDIDFQRILWQSVPSSSLREYQLLTVTYGMACAPYLALRVLQQLTLDEGHEFPLAAEVLRSNIYVDDVLFGSDDVDSLQVRSQLISLLTQGGFTLRKWASNMPTLLADIDSSALISVDNKILAWDDHVKILGLCWNPIRDEFNFTVSSFNSPAVTKRSILSIIARLYDPLGWATPVIIQAKILIQSLWKSHVGWDDPLAQPLHHEWTDLSARLYHLNSVKIPRWTHFSPRVPSMQLHGFADASSSAYAAVVFLRLYTDDHRVVVSLLAGKSKVAPLSPVSVPRLELCAAVLLSRLIVFATDTLALREVPVFCWSDSTVVLTWISHHPSRWKMFVANRVAKIQSLVPSATWRYVPSHENPADCASRGLFADELVTHPLCWNGPDWLSRESDS